MVGDPSTRDHLSFSQIHQFLLKASRDS